MEALMQKKRIENQSESILDENSVKLYGEIGSMSAVAAKLLSDSDVQILAIIGPGSVGRACLMSYMACFPNLNTVMIKGSTVHSVTAKRLKKYIEEHYPRIKHIQICTTLRETVREADIISESVSSVEAPYFKREWFKPGAVVISTGAFTMNRYEMVSMRKVVDDYTIYEAYASEMDDFVKKDHRGHYEMTGCLGVDFAYMVKEGLVNRDSILKLGDLIQRKVKGRSFAEEVVLVALQGTSLEFQL